ncbi:hypothetical protein CNECB9_3150011 [Cupriavidus necator]|uniref:Uncharacterized protein n=1 Tax=Cupriavidus necator TaxID=106590 RepID=A0A1K0IGE6_CUPNE|nr:hypothetical protein CNECB9_3150011 [Cupriavidus necator]
MQYSFIVVQAIPRMVPPGLSPATQLCRQNPPRPPRPTAATRCSTSRWKKASKSCVRSTASIAR